MNREQKGFLTELILRRSGLMELFLAAVLLAIGVEFITSAVPSLLGLNTGTTLLLGIGIVLIALLYFVRRLSLNRNRSESFHGFLIYQMEDKQLIQIPRYDYGTYMPFFINAAFAENEALKILWEKEPPGWESTSDTNRKPPVANELIIEATEYFLLNKLSTHLSDYFRYGLFEKQHLKEFQRGDVPDILLTNRFMELFSRPMDQRQFFVENLCHNNVQFQATSYDAQGQVEFAIRDNTFYHQFKLVLPAESKIRRLGIGTIELETSRFQMEISTKFDGYTANLPKGFREYYLHIEELPLDAISFIVVADISVSFKLSALLSASGWNYYWWVDSFVEELEQEIAQDSFFESIGWETALTVIESFPKATAHELSPPNDS